MRRFYPPEGHDFINTAEIRQIAAENEQRRAIKYLQDAVDFRVAFLEKMRKCGALNNEGIGWAIFAPEIDQNESSQIILPKIDYLVSTYPVAHKATSFLRIIRNERIGVGDTLSLLTHDFALDPDNDCLYHIDALPLSGKAKLQILGKSAVTFMYGEDENGDTVLAVSDNYYENFCPMLTIQAQFNLKQSEIAPLGDYNCLEDRIAALEFGKEMFGELLNCEPLIINRPNQD